MASSRTGYKSIKKEAVKATPVKPTHFIPYKSGGIEYVQEIIENNPIKGNRWNALQAKKGKVNTEGKFEYDLDTYYAGYIFRGILGAYTKTTVVAGVYKHTFNVANDIPSFSIEEVVGNPEGEDREVIRSFGVMFDSMELGATDGIASLNVNAMAHGQFQKAKLEANVVAGTGVSVVVKSSEAEGLLTGDILEIVDVTNTTSENITATTVVGPTITANVVGNYDATDEVKVQLRPQTAAFDCKDTVQTFSNFAFQFGADLTAAASAAEENVENWTLTYNNNLEMRYGSKRRSPSVIAPKGAGATLKYTKYFENTIDRDRYLDQTRQACILTGDLEMKIGATAYNYKMEVRMNDLRFTARTRNVGNDELIVAEFTATVFYNCTDGKAIEINLWNDLADYDV